jgi:hypothetical protein
MKCQSDFDNTERELFRQSDDCFPEWWETENPASSSPPPRVKAASETDGTAENEAVRRGLLKKDEKGRMCVSCSEGAE